MPRDIPVGNGKLLVCFDKYYQIRDLYFPHVGQENHLGGQACRLGVWVGGQFSWVGPDWNLALRYVPGTMATQVNLYQKDMGILLSCRDIVDFHENIYLREITVENLSPRPREVRLFFTQDFNIYGNSVGDTAAFDPKTRGVVHYKGARYFLANGLVTGGGGLAEFAAGQKGGGLEGTYRDAEDGKLSGNPIAQGSVDSVIALHLHLEGTSKGLAYYWIAAGENWDEVRRLDGLVKQRQPESMIQRTMDYWNLWVRKEQPPLEGLPEKIGGLYTRSLLVLRTQIDWQGGILAGNDSDAIQFNRDTYSYVWPRDGALVANALDLAGYPIPAQDFFSFITKLIQREGYLLHKYNPDGTLASSWHPWVQKNLPQLPIQEDETALVLWALWQHFVLYRDLEFIKPFYRPFIKRGADFMASYRDPQTGLPLPSYDLWEEQRGVMSYTVGAVFGGMVAAALFCTVFGETDIADGYLQVAAEIRDGASRYLWCEDLNRFCRMIETDPDGHTKASGICDASLWGLFSFGMYTANDRRIQSTMEALKDNLWVKTGVGGMARYEGDGFHRASPTTENPWFICTLWYTDYLIEKASSEGELKEAMEILLWVTKYALPSGVLAEQIHPFSGEPLSISPLTWSHATFLATTQKLIRRMQKTKICPTCGLPMISRIHREDWIGHLFSQTCDAVHGSCQVK